MHASTWRWLGDVDHWGWAASNAFLISAKFVVLTAGGLYLIYIIAMAQ
jgi:hypothetical protein